MKKSIIFLLIILSITIISNAQATGCGGLPFAGKVYDGVYNFAPGCVHQLTDTLEFRGNNITINGNDGTIQGNGTFELMYSNGGVHLAFNDVTLTGGHSYSGPRGSVLSQFGNGNSLNLNNVIITNNHGQGPILDLSLSGADHTISNTAIFNNTSLPNSLIDITASKSDFIFINNRLTNNTSNAGHWGMIRMLLSEGDIYAENNCIEDNVMTDNLLMYFNGSAGHTVQIEAMNNWWGAAQDPFTLYNFDISKAEIFYDPYLTTRPASCDLGNSSNSAGGPLRPPDDRINWNMGDHYAIGYRGNTPDGGALVFWCTYVSPDNEFSLVSPPMVITPADVKDIPDKLDENLLIQDYENDYCHVQFHVLTTGRYQITLGLDSNGNIHELIFDGLNADNLDHSVFNIFD